MHLHTENAAGRDVRDADGGFKDPLSLSPVQSRIGSKFFAVARMKDEAEGKSTVEKIPRRRFPTLITG